MNPGQAPGSTHFLALLGSLSLVLNRTRRV